MAEEEQAAQETEQPKRQIKTQKVYLKDVSFETPNSPVVFSQEWKPKLTIDFGSGAEGIGDDYYEVILNLTVTATIGDKTAYLAEVQQAGVFQISGLDKEGLQYTVNVPCLSLLYPYAAAEVADLVAKGGFPQLALSPVSFESIYRQRLQEAQEQEQASGTAT